MTITEKIPNETANEIKLYKEGVFWVAYEQSAYYIWQTKGYKATKKMIKTLGKEIVSVGFPQSSYEIFTHTIHVVLEKDEEFFKVFSLEKAIDMEAFRQWKANLPLTPARHCEGEARCNEPHPQPLSTRRGEPSCSTQSGVYPEASPLSLWRGVGGEVENEIYQKLYDFPLENKTPMECLMFLSEIKKICYSHGNL